MSRLLCFGRWPSGHDVDLLLDHDAEDEIGHGTEALLPLSRAQRSGEQITVPPSDFPELGAFAEQLDPRRWGVPVDLFLGSAESDFNPALWITESGWLLSWRFCGTDFFAEARPLTGDHDGDRP